MRCADQSLYTGITTDPQRRLRQHRGELKGGARYTRARLPLQMVYLEPKPNRSSASKRESEIKALRVSQKEALILSATNLEEISC